MEMFVSRALSLFGVRTAPPAVWFARRQELWTGMLDSLFLQGSWEIVHHREWRAYPVLTPKKVRRAGRVSPDMVAKLRYAPRVYESGQKYFLPSPSLAGSSGP